MRQLLTAEEWKNIISKQRGSGLSVAEYARKNKIKESTLQYWSKKVKNEKSIKLVKVPTQIEVKKSEPTLLLIDNIKLEIPAEVSSEKIAKIISVIREDI